MEDKNTAEEIVEECMVYLWERKERMSQVKDIKSYLYTMVKNKAFAHLKQVDKTVSLDAQPYEQFSQSDEFTIEEDVHAILLNAIDSLPEKCKVVFKLSCLEGIKYKDIAEDLNISVNTVKSQRARALELIKEKLKGQSILAVYLLFLLKLLFF